MSSPNSHSKPDLDETINVTEAHGRVTSESAACEREKRLADSGRESVPLWVITACGVVLLIAGGVLGNAGTLLSYDSTFRKDYVRGLAPGGAETGPEAKIALVAFSAKGSKIYSAKCNGCHGSDGKGDGVNYPSLAGSSFVIEENQKFAMIILNGIQGPISNGKTYGAGIMPAQGASSMPSLFKYMACAAKGANSRKGVPGSSNICTRSRGGSLPRATCLALAFSPPPAADFFNCTRRSSTITCRAAALAKNSAERLLSCVCSTDMFEIS
jgi:hypothetical protein